MNLDVEWFYRKLGPQILGKVVGGLQAIRNQIQDQFSHGRAFLYSHEEALPGTYRQMVSSSLANGINDSLGRGITWDYFILLLFLLSSTLLSQIVTKPGLKLREISALANLLLQFLKG